MIIGFNCDTKIAPQEVQNQIELTCLQKLLELTAQYPEHPIGIVNTTEIQHLPEYACTPTLISKDAWRIYEQPFTEWSFDIFPYDSNCDYNVYDTGFTCRYTKNLMAQGEPEQLMYILQGGSLYKGTYKHV